MPISDPRYVGMPVALFEALYRAGIRAGQEIFSAQEKRMADLDDFDLNTLVDDLAVTVLGTGPQHESTRHEAGYPDAALKKAAANELFTLTLAAQGIGGEPTCGASTSKEL